MVPALFVLSLFFSICLSAPYIWYILLVNCPSSLPIKRKFLESRGVCLLHLLLHPEGPENGLTCSRGTIHLCELINGWLYEKSFIISGEHWRFSFFKKECRDIHKILAYKFRGVGETLKSIHESILSIKNPQDKKLDQKSQILDSNLCFRKILLCGFW